MNAAWRKNGGISHLTITATLPVLLLYFPLRLLLDLFYSFCSVFPSTGSCSHLPSCLFHSLFIHFSLSCYRFRLYCLSFQADQKSIVVLWQRFEHLEESHSTLKCLVYWRMVEVKCFDGSICRVHYSVAPCLISTSIQPLSPLQSLTSLCVTHHRWSFFTNIKSIWCADHDG